MTLADTLARVAARAGQQQAKAERSREDMRRDHPGPAAAFDWASPAFGRDLFITDPKTGLTWGRARTERITPPIPGCPGGKAVYE